MRGAATNQTDSGHLLPLNALPGRVDEDRGSPVAAICSAYSIEYKAGNIWSLQPSVPGVVLADIPRYHPWWAHWVMRVPGLRELVAWNLLLVLRRL